MVRQHTAFPKAKLYSTKIIKTGALLADTRTFFLNWNPSISAKENVKRFRCENIFGKTSRSRVENILAIFRQRYLAEETTFRALLQLFRSKLPNNLLDRILYFHALRSDQLLHDVVAQFLNGLYQSGRHDVSPLELQRVIADWCHDGNTSTSWSTETITRTVQGVLSTLRDFGVLTGAVKKRLAPPALPLGAFAYIACYLRQNQPSGDRLLNDKEWQLFFLSPTGVERLFLEADQMGLLKYHAAGSVIRIDFPAETLESYADVIAQRAH